MSEPKPKTAEDVYEAALALSEIERERLKSMLTREESSGWASPEIEQAWVDECNRRMRLIEEGKAGWVDGEQVLAKLRKSVTE